MRLVLSREDDSVALEDIWLRFDDDTSFSSAPYLAMGYTIMEAYVIGAGGAGGIGGVSVDDTWGGGGGGGGGSGSYINIRKYLAALPAVMPIKIGRGGIPSGEPGSTWPPAGGPTIFDRYIAYGGGNAGNGQNSPGGNGGDGGGGGAGGSYHGPGDYAVSYPGATGTYGAGDGGNGSTGVVSVIGGTEGDFVFSEPGVVYWGGDGGGGGGRGDTYPNSDLAVATAPGHRPSPLMGPTEILGVGGGYVGGQGAAGGQALDAYGALAQILGSTAPRPGDGGRGGNGKGLSAAATTPYQRGANGCVIIKLTVVGTA